MFVLGRLLLVFLPFRHLVGGQQFHPGIGTLMGLFDWWVHFMVSFVGGAIKAVLCFIYIGV